LNGIGALTKSREHCGSIINLLIMTDCLRVSRRNYDMESVVIEIRVTSLNKCNTPEKEKTVFDIFSGGKR